MCADNGISAHSGVCIAANQGEEVVTLKDLIVGFVVQTASAVAAAMLYDAIKAHRKRPRRRKGHEPKHLRKR